VLTGADAYGDWHSDAARCSAAYHTRSMPLHRHVFRGTITGGHIEPRNVTPLCRRVRCSLFATGLTSANHATAQTATCSCRKWSRRHPVFTGQQSRVFAADCRSIRHRFWPPGPSPRYVYVAKRIAWCGSRIPTDGPPEMCPVAPDGGHWTTRRGVSPMARDVRSVGSASKVMTGVARRKNKAAPTCCRHAGGQGSPRLCLGLRNSRRSDRATHRCIMVRGE